MAVFGRAAPPFASWSFTTLDERIGGPDFVDLGVPRDRVAALASAAKRRGRKAAALQEVDRRDGARPTVLCRELRRAYGPVVALDDVTLRLYESEICAVVGPNGAGKTTACGLATGLVPSDSPYADGGVRVYGHGVATEGAAARQLTGFCPQHDCLFESAILWLE